MGLKTKNADTLAVILAAEIKKKEKEDPSPYMVTSASIDRRLVLKVDKVWAKEKRKDDDSPGTTNDPDVCGDLAKATVFFNDPADRIMNMEVSLKLTGTPPFVIADWDAFKSQYLSVDLGSVSSKLGTTLAAEAAANASGKATTASGNTGIVVKAADEGGNGGGETGTTDGTTGETGFSFGPKVSGSLTSEYVRFITNAVQPVLALQWHAAAGRLQHPTGWCAGERPERQQ
ncbi:MAG: hypothetical protein IPP83_07240 [Flavobacteriales bacterium]|nr:hypothetical protein [Flavobacteriales bacterium]